MKLNKNFEEQGFVRTLSINKGKKEKDYENNSKKNKRKPDYSKQREKKRNWE